MENNRKLKPCPFCGGNASIHQQRVCFGHGDYGNEISVTCEKCYAEGPTFEMYHKNMTLEDARAKAVDAWNQRKTKLEKY